MHSSRKLSPFPQIAFAAIATLFSLPVAALADSVAPAGSDQSIFGDHTEVVAGIGAGLNPRYMGAAGTHLLVIPTISVQRGIFFADSVRGIGAEYQSPSGFYISQAFNYDPGRTDGNSYFRPGSSRLKGMGNVKGAITSNTTLSQRILPWLSVNAQAEFGLDGHDRGNQYRIGLESTVESGSKNDTLTTDLGAKLGDSQYNQSYFGVTPTQSANTGFRRYTPGSGIYAYFLTAAWDHTIDRQWSTQLVLGGTMYANHATDGPIAQHKFAPVIYSALNYAF